MTLDLTRIDLLVLMQDIPLKRVASTKGGEWQGPCPFCGGKDRFVVQPNQQPGRFWCRVCRTNGDAINYLQLKGMSFRDACQFLQVPLEPNPAKVQSTASSPSTQDFPCASDATALDDPIWQAQAREFCRDARAALWSRNGTQARQWLIQRGLTEPVIQKAFLGYQPCSEYILWGSTKVYLPRGIVIPWWVNDAMWKVNIRRLDNEEPKYWQPTGSGNALYGADALRSGTIPILVEGEFDVLTLRVVLQAASTESRSFVPVATGSAYGARRLRWITQIARASQVVLAFDADHAGDPAADWWQNTLQSYGVQTFRLRPLYKDVNDMLRLGASIPDWLAAVPF